jgi:hypothetical protein
MAVNEIEALRSTEMERRTCGIADYRSGLARRQARSAASTTSKRSRGDLFGKRGGGFVSNEIED